MSGLTALKVKRETKPGMHGDGNGLYLQITPSKSGGVSKSWLYRYKVGGRSRKLGLGSLHTVSLADARQKAVVRVGCCWAVTILLRRSAKQRLSRD